MNDLYNEKYSISRLNNIFFKACVSGNLTIVKNIINHYNNMVSIDNINTFSKNINQW